MFPEVILMLSQSNKVNVLQFYKFIIVTFCWSVVLFSVILFILGFSQLVRFHETVINIRTIPDTSPECLTQCPSYVFMYLSQ